MPEDTKPGSKPGLVVENGDGVTRARQGTVIAERES